jgi:hypothetical protein
MDGKPGTEVAMNSRLDGIARLAARGFLLAVSGTVLIPAAALAADKTRPVTFTRDVAPILQDKCQNCHRPGEMAPMALRTYKEVRPWARSIRNKVSKREMPPWFIDRNIGIQRFKNDWSLSDAEVDTIVRWVDAGAPEGSPADMPPPKAFPDDDGWHIGRPDLVVTQAKPFRMYAQGSDWWESFTIDTGLTEDRWVKAVQLKPGNRKIVHHFCAGPVNDPGGRAAAAPVNPQDQYAEEEARAAEEERRQAAESNAGASSSSFGCFLPGKPGVFYNADTGVLLKKGSKVAFQMHYSASGEESTDQSSVGFVLYPAGVTPKRALLSTFFQKFPAYELDIPPNARVTNDAYFHLQKPALLQSFTPHMHFRGRALQLEAILPNGRVQMLSAVDKYNFGWQLEYAFADEVAPLLPAGTMLHAIVVHDNTSANPFNPDPNRWVGQGQASAEEMGGTFVSWVYLDDDEYRKMAADRRARARAAQTDGQQP